MKDLLLLALKRVGCLLEHTWVYLGSLAAMALLVGTLGMSLFRTIEWRSVGGESEYFYGVMNHSGAELPEGLDAVPGNERGKTGRPHVRFEYGEDGRLQRLVHVGASGEVSCMPGSAVAEQRLEYDGAGRLVRKQNFDQRGVPAEDAAGVAVRLFAYDEAGNLVRRESLSADGALVAPPVSGYAVEEIQYDGHNRPVSRVFLDAFGKPVINSRGESRLVYRYDDAAGVQTRENYVGNALAENNHGYAVERCEMSQDGRCTAVSWLDAQGRPVVNQAVGSVAFSAHREPETGYCRESFSCGDASHPGVLRSCAERLARYDGQGRLEWECFNAADGLPCLHPCYGYAERVCRYDADGRLQTEYFWDASGHPAFCCRKRYCREGPGEPECVLSLFCDGSTSVAPVKGVRKTELSERIHRAL